VQPKHLDSRGAQYIQMRLQQERYHAKPVVLFNRNSQRYLDAPVGSTTSYVVQAYPSPGTDAGLASASDVPGSQVICFAGDVSFSRNLLQLLADPASAERLRAEIQSVLHGCPLVLNLEGVVVPELPTNLGPVTLAMPADLTVQWLKALNVVAVSVANNHTRDLGDEPFREMVKLLAAAGIRVLRHGDIADLGAFRLAALTDLDNAATPQTDRISTGDLDAIAQSHAAPPLFAFVHWGIEYDDAPGQRERMLADELRRRAVALIVGAHPHRADGKIEALAGGEAQLVYSLGNFLFDQRSDRVSGSVLEVRLFDQGTFFTRLVPIPNFYRDALRGPR
jgi:poly-gamma-glutamate synthesis protein (capsule biosynthesis protein)